MKKKNWLDVPRIFFKNSKLKYRCLLLLFVFPTLFFEAYEVDTDIEGTRNHY